MGDFMKKNSVKVDLKQLRRIPKKTITFLLMIWLVALCLLIGVIFPAHRTIDNLQECEINIDRVYLHDSHNTKGSRMKLEITSGATTYYLWYPQSKYIDYAHEVENELLSGDVIVVKAKIADRQSIRDRILNKVRVADLRSDTSVYYDIETERAYQQRNHVSLCVVFAFVLLLWVVGVLANLLIYGVLSLRARR